jgi:MATE family multidrug resistance protein
MLMMCLDWWIVEIATMVAGLLPNPELSLAVMGICVQITSLFFMIPLGICIALRIRVSNLLGASHILPCYIRA